MLDYKTFNKNWKRSTKQGEFDGGHTIISYHKNCIIDVPIYKIGTNISEGKCYVVKKLDDYFLNKEGVLLRSKILSTSRNQSILEKEKKKVLDSLNTRYNPTVLAMVNNSLKVLQQTDTRGNVYYSLVVYYLRTLVDVNSYTPILTFDTLDEAKDYVDSYILNKNDRRGY